MGGLEPLYAPRRKGNPPLVVNIKRRPFNDEVPKLSTKNRYCGLRLSLSSWVSEDTSVTVRTWQSMTLASVLLQRYLLRFFQSGFQVLTHPLAAVFLGHCGRLMRLSNCYCITVWHVSLSRCRLAVSQNVYYDEIHRFQIRLLSDCLIL